MLVVGRDLCHAAIPDVGPQSAHVSAFAGEEPPSTKPRRLEHSRQCGAQLGSLDCSLDCLTGGVAGRKRQTQAPPGSESFPRFHIQGANTMPHQRKLRQSLSWMVQATGLPKRRGGKWDLMANCSPQNGRVPMPRRCS